jgi:hypothetical protein
MTYADNGILAKVPGEFIAMASKGLPDPETATEGTLSAEIDASWAGRVRLTYVRQLVRHRKHSHWYWLAVRADAAALV